MLLSLSPRHSPGYLRLCYIRKPGPGALKTSENFRYSGDSEETIPNPASSQAPWEISTSSKIKNSIAMLFQRRKTPLNTKHRIQQVPWSMEKNCPFRYSRYCHQMSPNFQMKLMQTPRPLHQQGLMLLETPARTEGIALLPVLSIFYMETISVPKYVHLIFS